MQSCLEPVRTQEWYAVAGDWTSLARALPASGSTPKRRKPLSPASSMVGARGFEPLTSSASRKRSPPELSALVPRCYTGRFEAGTGIEPVYEALQASA